LDAEALYSELLRGVCVRPDTRHARLVGITSGGAWLAERLQHRPGPAGPGRDLVSHAPRRFAQRGLAAAGRPSCRLM
jgi:pyrimidine operon attenuation protein/uracil phosphoribosyltransferase